MWIFFFSSKLKIVFSIRCFKLFCPCFGCAVDRLDCLLKLDWHFGVRVYLWFSLVQFDWAWNTELSLETEPDLCICLHSPVGRPLKYLVPASCGFNVFIICESHLKWYRSLKLKSFPIAKGRSWIQDLTSKHLNVKICMSLAFRASPCLCIGIFNQVG